MLKTTGLLLLVGTCISANFLDFSQLESFGQGLKNKTQELATGAGNGLQNVLGKVFDGVDHIQLGVDAVANKVDNTVTQGVHNGHYFARLFVIGPQLYANLQEMKYYYNHSLPIPQRVYDQFVPLVTQLEDDFHQEVDYRAIQFKTESERLGTKIALNGGDVTGADVDGVTKAADDIYSFITKAQTLALQNTPRDLLIDLAKKGNQPAIKAGLALRAVATRNVDSVQSSVGAIEQELKDNDVSVKKLLASTPEGSPVYNELREADQRLGDEINKYNALFTELSTLVKK